MYRKIVLLGLAVLVQLAPGSPGYAQWAVPPPAPVAQGPFESLVQTERRGLPPLRLAAERPSRVPGHIVVKYARSVPQHKATLLSTPIAAKVVSAIPQLDIQVMEVENVDLALQQLRKDPNVVWAQQRLFRYPLVLTPNDPAYNEIDRLIATEPDAATWYKWDSHMISTGWGWQVWPSQFYSSSLPKGSHAVTVAVIDTGMDYGHPDFINAGGTGTSVEQGGQLLRSLDASIFNGIVTPEAPDGYGHGTHVAGIVAASTNNGIGTVGTGYNANIMSIRVVDAAGYGTDSDIAQAIVYAVDHGALILNLSLGSYEYSQAEADAVNYAWRKNVLVIAAAGNDGNDKLNYPSALSKVLSVAATSRISVATYSNYGPFVGICAPGGDFDYEIMWLLGVYSTMPTYWVTLNDPTQYGAAQNYDYLMGTSMAAPHVAGVAAIRAGQKGYTRATPQANLKLWQALQRSADGYGGWNPYIGFGLVNVEGVVYEDIDPNWRGDTMGCITGQVRYRGTPVQNASIVAKPVGGGSNFSASSRSDGGYRVINVTQGVYDVSATLFGETVEITNVVVTPGCDIPGQDINIGAWPSEIVVDDAIGSPGLPVAFTATFHRTDTGAPVEDIRLFFGVDGTEVGSAMTNAAGVAEFIHTLPGGMARGPHSIDVNYYGDAAYTSSSGTGILTIPAGTGTFMYAPDRSGTITETIILRGFLYQADGSVPIPNRTVEFAVEGTPVGTATTDAGGRASLDWTVTDGPASRPLSAAFAGDDTFDGSSAVALLTAESVGTRLFGQDREGMITDYRLLTAHLYRTDDSPIYNKEIAFAVDGTHVGTDRTRATGRANVGYTIPSGDGAGVRAIQATWAGDGGYGPASATNALTVSKTLPYIWVLSKSAPQNGTTSLYAYFRRLRDYQRQAGKSVTFSVDGTDVATVTTDALGVARYAYTTVEAPGAHALRCTFAGDQWIEAGYGEATLTIY